MYNGKVIKELLAINGKRTNDLLEYLGCRSRATASQLMTGNPTVKKLEMVADFFGVSMDVFFEREIKPEDKRRKITETEYLKELLKAKDEIIAEKNLTIRVLEDLNRVLSDQKIIDKK